MSYPMRASEEDRRKYIKSAPNVTEAVRRAASLVGINLLDYQAQAIANAARTFAEGVVAYRHEAPRHLWEIEDYRSAVRRDMRHHLLDEVTSEGLIPVALPAEKLQYARAFFGAPIGPAAGMPELADWDTVMVSLEVPVRKPPVDRKKAVRQGILTGEPADD